MPALKLMFWVTNATAKGRVHWQQVRDGSSAPRQKVQRLIAQHQKERVGTVKIGSQEGLVKIIVKVLSNRKYFTAQCKMKRSFYKTKPTRRVVSISWQTGIQP